MFVFALSGQSCVNPVLLAGSVVADVGVAQRHQFTGGVLRSISGRVGAVNHDVSRFVRQQCWSKLVDLVGRQIDRTGQMRVMITRRRQSLDKPKLFGAVNLPLQLIA